MSNGKYQTIEEKLGILTGILQNIPTQIDQLFSKINEVVEKQSGLHATIDSKLEQLDKEVDSSKIQNLERDTQDLLAFKIKLEESKLLDTVKDLKIFVDDAKETKSFFRKHSAVFLTSFLSFVFGSVVVFFLLKVLGKL